MATKIFCFSTGSRTGYVRDCDDHSRCFKPNCDVLQTLTKWFIAPQPNQSMNTALWRKRNGKQFYVNKCKVLMYLWFCRNVLSQHLFSPSAELQTATSNIYDVKLRLERRLDVSYFVFVLVPSSQLVIVTMVTAWEDAVVSARLSLSFAKWRFHIKKRGVLRRCSSQILSIVPAMPSPGFIFKQSLKQEESLGTIFTGGLIHIWCSVECLVQLDKYILRETF